MRAVRNRPTSRSRLVTTLPSPPNREKGAGAGRPLHARSCCRRWSPVATLGPSASRDRDVARGDCPPASGQPDGVARPTVFGTNPAVGMRAASIGSRTPLALPTTMKRPDDDPRSLSVPRPLRTGACLSGPSRSMPIAPTSASGLQPRPDVQVVAGSDDGVVSTALAAEGDGYFSGVADVAAGGRYRYRLNDSKTLYPDPASRYQPDGPHAASMVVDRGVVPVDRCGLARCVAHRSGGLRATRRDLHHGGHLDGGGRGDRRTGRPRYDGDRADAGRRVRGAIRLGLRRRRSVRPVASVRRARPTARLHRPGASRRDRRHPRRGLQPPRPGRQLPARVFTGLLHRPLRQRVGRRASTSMAPTRGRCASSSSPTPPTGSTNSTSTACASTPRSRSSMPRRSTCSTEITARGAPRRGAAVDLHRGRERASASAAGSRRSRMAVSVSTRCGMTISITARWWR